MTATERHLARRQAAGQLLRRWRERRRISQMALSLMAGVSTRHLSCIETGKATASRSALRAISDALELTLRERNRLFAAAGYAAEYSETPIDAGAMARLSEAVDRILCQHAPFPAFAMDRRWNIIRSNAPYERLFHALMGRAPRHKNIVRQIFDENDVRPYIANWDETARQVFRHLIHELAASADDVELSSLVEEVEELAPQIVGMNEDVMAGPLPIFTTQFEGNGIRFEFFSTLTVFGGARDLTIDELRVEAMFPADAATELFFRGRKQEN